MKKSSNAWKLVKSLTMSEKRYFKIFSGRHIIGSQNKSWELFDIMEGLSLEDDNAIKAALSKRGISAEFLSADKNYLYQLMLKSLNAFHDSKTTNLEIKDLLVSIEILFHKGLYEEALKLVKRGEELAAQCENYQLRIDLLMWKKKCAGYSLGLNNAAEANHEITEQVKQLEFLKRVTDLYYESNILQANNEKYGRKEILQRFRQITEAPELKKLEKISSLSAKVFARLTLANYHFICDDKNKELKQLQLLIDETSDTVYAQENPLDYISIYNRLLAVKKYFPAPDFAEDVVYLRKFADTLKFSKDVAKHRAFLHSTTHLLEYHIINNRFAESAAIIRTLERESDKMEVVIEPYHKIYFYYLNVVSLIFTGEFHRALKFSNKIINDFRLADRPQIYRRCELLNIIIHFELRNYSLIPNLYRQILRQEKQNAILLPLEKQIGETINKISLLVHGTVKEERALLQQMLDCLLKFKRKGSQDTLIHNYEKWIRSKLVGKTVEALYS